MNSLTSLLPHAQTNMFLLHASYGYGATVSPFVSTAFVKTITGKVWLYYTVSLGLALGVAGVLVVVFRGRRECDVVGTTEERNQGMRREVGQVENVGSMETLAEEEIGVQSEPVETIQMGNEEKNEDVEACGSARKLSRILRCRQVHIMAFYLLFYVSQKLSF